MTDTLTLPPQPFNLARGSHSTLKQGACFNELAAVLAGEPFSASPSCVSPVIRRMGMSLNDRLDDERRQLLRPFVLRSLGTATDGREEERRQMCTEWLLHHALPDLLDRADRKEVADKLRALPDDLAVEGVRRAIHEARDEAWEARQAAVGRLRDRIREELEKHGVKDAAAVADADAVAVAVAVAAAAAVAAADAAAAAAAVADADAVAVAVADAVAAAAADAKGYWAIRGAVYKAVYAKAREKADEIYGGRSAELLDSVLDLMDRMCPAAPLMVPAIPMDIAELVCAAP